MTMAEMEMIFIETSFKTRIALLVNLEDDVLAFKDKLRKEHKTCFPDLGDITVSAVKVNWRNHFYHLSDSMILSKVFEDENCERFVFVDVASVGQKHEERSKKRKIKSSSDLTRKKLAHVPIESKDIDNVTSLGDNQNQDGLDDDHVKDLNADQTLEEANEKDLEKGVTNASAAVVMIDQETDLEKVNLIPTAEDVTSESLPITHVETIQIDDEKVDNGEETKVVKPKNRTKSSKEPSRRSRKQGTKQEIED